MNSAAGQYDVVAVTNWRSGSMSRTVSLQQKLGLEPGRYVAFDFWNQKSLGIVQDDLPLEVEPHDTRVVLLHRVLDEPQLIGISRHITGSFSVLDQHWNAGTGLLAGTAETVRGDPYAIWAYVPTRFHVADAGATVQAGTAIPVEQDLSANTVMLRFPGQSQPVAWHLRFTEESAK